MAHVSVRTNNKYYLASDKAIDEGSPFSDIINAAIGFLYEFYKDNKTTSTKFANFLVHYVPDKIRETYISKETIVKWNYNYFIDLIPSLERELKIIFNEEKPDFDKLVVRLKKFFKTNWPKDIPIDGNLVKTLD